jgi:ribosomal-protein-alanine N-acetyltransferase
VSLVPPIPRHGPSDSPIRTGGVDDLDSVMAIMQSAFRAEYGESWTRSQCAGIMPMAGVVLRLVDGDEASGALAFSLSRTIADEAELLLIAVAPQAQRGGLGRRLVADFVALAEQRGARRLHLEVRDGNPAIALYRATGFVVAGRRQAYYHGPGGESCDALTLVKSL